MSHAKLPSSFRIAAAIGLSALAASIAWLHLGEALWNDEIYTLKYFVDRGLGTVLTDYHVPNNHVLANVGHWLWAQLAGPLDAGLEQPWRLRLWPALLSAGTVLVVLRTARGAWGPLAGWLAGLVLLTTLAFGNFAFQLRGYPLTLLLGAALLLPALRTAAGAGFGARDAAIVALLTAGLLYTIPSNLYYVLAVAMAGALAAGWQTRAQRVSAAWWLGALAAGGALAVAFYTPILADVLRNPYVDGGQGGVGEAIRNFRQTLWQLAGWRFLLVPIAAWGWWLTGREASPRRRQLLVLAEVVVLPFILSGLRGDTPPLRAFLVVLPAFALLLAFGWTAAAESSGPTGSRVVLAVGAAICVAGYAYAVADARQRLRHDFDTLGRQQDLNYAYYQFWYDPAAEFELFRQRFPGKTIVVETSEPYDVPVFLQHFGIATAPLDSIEAYILRRQTLYVSTRYPKNFIRQMETLQPRWNCSYLQPRERYPRVVVCSCTGKSKNL